EIDSAGLETLQIQLLHVVRSRLEDDLELLMLEETLRVLAEPPVRRPARRLHVGNTPRRRTEHSQKRLGMHRARAHLDVERLLQETAARDPEFGQFEDELLQCDHANGALAS